MEPIKTSNSIDWSSQENEFMPNPHLVKVDQGDLENLFSKAVCLKKINGHVWIASSGSSRKKNESLKLIALSKKAFLVSAEAVNFHLQSSSNDTWIQVLPRFHVGGLSIEARAHLSGAKVVNGLDNNVWNPKHFAFEITKFNATLSSLVPTQIFDLIAAKIIAPASLRAIVVGGAPLSQELYKKGRELGWPLLPSYGLTECCSQVATAELDSLSKDEFPSFKVLKHCKVQVTAEGLLKIHSAALLTGYAQKINKIFQWVEPVENNGYLTADRGEIRDSFLIPLGRAQDYIKINGEGVNLYRLRELLEQVVMENYPAHIDEITLVATEQVRSGFELVLVCERQVGKNTAKKIQINFNSRVSPIERLLKIIEVEKIPRSALGKITGTNKI